MMASLQTTVRTSAPTQAHAFIGVDERLGHTFRFNPDEVSWDYSENIFSQDTLGGRVVQLLSISLNGMVVTGRAGDRGELQRLAKNIKNIMGYHVSTLQPVHFKVPSRSWNFRVYIKAMPSLTWDVSATSYPYQLELAIEEDLNGIKTHDVNTQILKRLASGIGYDYDNDVHGGDADLFKREYEIIKANQDAASGGAPVKPTGTGVQPSGSIQKPQGCTPPDNLVTIKGHQGFQLQSIAAQAFECAEAKFGQRVTISSAYRSCDQQRQACISNCGNPNGCDGSSGLPCAKPGTSNHQGALAVDVPDSLSRNSKFASAMRSCGWSWLGEFDPVHWDFGAK